mgnify:CR=1 FL=1
MEPELAKRTREKGVEHNEPPRQGSRESFQVY